MMSRVLGNLEGGREMFPILVLTNHKRTALLLLICFILGLRDRGIDREMRL